MYNTQLETFIKIADAGSFSKAAELLYISPNAIIKQINILEAHLELRLFERTHRGIALTAAGQSIYNDAKYIIQYSKSSILKAKNATQSNDHIVRIGTSILTPTGFFMELWPQIHTISLALKFKLIPFENTPENAKEIMKNFGQNIDLVAGVFDDELLRRRQSAGLELTKEPICCAVSIHHKLANKEKLSIQDLYGENLMMIGRDWNSYVDLVRNDIENNHQQITIVDFPFYDVNVFNDCGNSNYILMAVGVWENVHPLLKIIPVDWDYVIPFGLIFSPTPSENVQALVRTVAQIHKIEY